MGFRDDGRATQVLIQFTDDESKDSVSCAFSGPVGRPRALAELVAHQCRFGAVYSGVAGNTGHNQLRQLSEVSSTITPPAYGVSPVFCETGINGTGMTPIGGGCPNVFELSSAGTGASTAAAQAVIEALDASPFRLTSSAAGTPTPGGSSTDFLQSAEFVAAGNPSFAPAPVLSPSAIDGSFATGTYDLRLILENLDVPPGSSAQTFPLYVHVLAGNAVVARDTLLIEVPGPVGVGSPHGGSPLTLRSLTENPFATDWAASWCCRTKARPG